MMSIFVHIAVSEYDKQTCRSSSKILPYATELQVYCHFCFKITPLNMISCFNIVI